MDSGRTKIRKKGEYCILCPGSELSMIEDAGRILENMQTLHAAGNKKICVDLTMSPVINSSVIGALIAFNNEMEKSGGELVILNARNVALETMVRSHINRVIRFIRDEDELA